MAELNIIFFDDEDIRVWANYIERKLKKHAVRCHKHDVELLFQSDKRSAQDSRETIKSCCNNVILVSFDLLERFRSSNSVTFVDLIINAEKSVIVYCAVSESEVQPYKNRFTHFNQWTKVSVDDHIELIKEIIRVVHQPLQTKPGSHGNQETTEQASSVPQLPPRQPLNAPDITREAKPRVNKKPMRNPSRRGQFRVEPMKVKVGRREKILIISLDRPYTGTVSAEFTAMVSGTVIKRPVSAKNLKSDIVFEVITPTDFPPSKGTLNIYCDKERIGLHEFLFQSEFDLFVECLNSSVSPMTLMCQALGVSANETKELDQRLLHILRRQTPNNFSNVFRLSEEDGIGSETSDRELPTLLHFAAKYGLCELMAMLVELPGARLAYSVTNMHGDYPARIASKAGHAELATFLEGFINEQEKMMEIYTSMCVYANKSEKEIQDTYNIMDFSADTTEYTLMQEDYMCMEGHDPSGQPGYLAMTRDRRANTGYLTMGLPQQKTRKQKDGDENDEEDGQEYTEVAEMELPKLRKPLLEPVSAKKISAEDSSQRNQEAANKSHVTDNEDADKYARLPVSFRSESDLGIMTPDKIKKEKNTDSLIEIMNDFKNKKYTMEEVNILFKDWQVRNNFHVQGSSFEAKKNKQKKLDDVHKDALKTVEEEKGSLGFLGFFRRRPKQSVKPKQTPKSGETQYAVPQNNTSIFPEESTQPKIPVRKLEPTFSFEEKMQGQGQDIVEEAVYMETDVKDQGELYTDIIDEPVVPPRGDGALSEASRSSTCSSSSRDSNISISSVDSGHYPEDPPFDTKKLPKLKPKPKPKPKPPVKTPSAHALMQELRKTQKNRSLESEDIPEEHAPAPPSGYYEEEDDDPPPPRPPRR